MILSREAEQELLASAQSEELGKDLSLLDARNKTPFIRGGTADVDAYVEFVSQFNDFINHQPKPFRKIIDRQMKL